jgi:hypothetical protein
VEIREPIMAAAAVAREQQVEIMSPIQMLEMAAMVQAHFLLGAQQQAQDRIRAVLITTQAVAAAALEKNLREEMMQLVQVV